MATVIVCTSDELKDGEGRKFHFRREGVRFEGFVVRVDGQVYAYENRCRHLPLPLDYGDGRFFTPDRKHLVCSSHGAMYEPRTGRCVQGPCTGALLKVLRIRESEDKIRIEFED